MHLRTRSFVLAGLLVALLLAGGVSHFASGHPDGLNKVAEDLGFIDSERDHAFGGSPLAGYDTRGVADSRLSGAVAGIAGVAITFAAAGGLFLLVRRRPAPNTSPGGPSATAGDGG